MAQKETVATEGFLSEALNLDTMNIRERALLFIANEIEAIAAVRNAIDDIELLIKTTAECVRNGGRCVYVGAGTSGRIAFQDAAECVPTFGIPEGIMLAVMAGGTEALTRSVEGAEDDTKAACAAMEALSLAEHDIVIGVAASGTTPFTRQAVEYAQECGSKTAFITCNPLPEGVADTVVFLNIGSPVIAGSTRLMPGTAQKIVLNTLSSNIWIELGRVYGPLMVGVQATNAKLVRRAVRLMYLLTGLPAESASELLGCADWYVPTAVVMHHRNISAPGARNILEDHGGHLRAVIGDVDFLKRWRT